jgi:opacity protein-like surface antigen
MRKFAKASLFAAILFGFASTALAQNYDGIGRLRFGVFMQGHLMPAEETKPAPGSSDLDGFGVGASFGYDWSLANGWVIGAEADGTATTGTAKFGTDSYDSDYLATFRGRLGKHLDSNWFVYGTAGWALNGLTYKGTTTASVDNPGAVLKVSGTLNGWTVGGGLEYRLYDMVLFGEYLYANFESFDFTGGSNLNHSLDTEAHVFRLGVKWIYGHDHYVDDVKRRY